MTTTEHRMKTAEARNALGEVIARARYANEPTIFMNRDKAAAVMISVSQYEQAKRIAEALQEARDGTPDLVVQFDDGSEAVIEVKSFRPPSS